MDTMVVRSAVARHQGIPEPAVSRRGFLKMSAVGVSAGLISGSAGYVTGWSHRAGGAISDWGAADIPAQNGRRVLVTGGNGYPQGDRSGLGYHAALALARAGAEVIIASRNQTRGEEAIRRIREAAPSARVRFEPLDLTNLSSVRGFSQRMRAFGQSLDLLINNAGVMGRPHRETGADGHERVFATNTLGHFALTALLLPVLRRGHDPRIVWVSSLRASNGIVRLDDLQLQQGYEYAAAYDQSKLANLILAYELERRSKLLGWGISSMASHPGVARTSLIPDGPGLESSEGWRFRWLPFLYQPADQGALPALYAAASPQAEAGRYYGPNGFQELTGGPGIARVPEAARNRRLAAELWTRLERLGQVSFS